MQNFRHSCRKKRKPRDHPLGPTPPGHQKGHQTGKKISGLHVPLRPLPLAGSSQMVPRLLQGLRRLRPRLPPFVGFHRGPHLAQPQEQLRAVPERLRPADVLLGGVELGGYGAAGSPRVLKKWGRENGTLLKMKMPLLSECTAPKRCAKSMHPPNQWRKCRAPHKYNRQ